MHTFRGSFAFSGSFALRGSIALRGEFDLSCIASFPCLWGEVLLWRRGFSKFFLLVLNQLRRAVTPIFRGLILLDVAYLSDLVQLCLLLLITWMAFLLLSSSFILTIISAREGCGVDNALIKGETERQWRLAPLCDE